MTEIDNIRVTVSGKQYTLTELPEPVTSQLSPEDSIKQKIIDKYKSTNLKLQYLKKVINHEPNYRNFTSLLTLDDDKKVVFKRDWSKFYTVNKKDATIEFKSVQDVRESITNGTIFADNDIYVYDPPNESSQVIEPPQGGSRRTYRKYSKRIKSSKKPSKSKSRKYLKHL